MDIQVRVYPMYGLNTPRGEIFKLNNFYNLLSDDSADFENLTF